MTGENDAPRRAEAGHSSQTARGPLSDLTVIDLTHVMAGPFATMILADLGAEVVKVEPPSGDMIRSNPPHVEEGEDYGGYFNSVNRNKKSVVINLKSDGGREAFKRLVADADVLIENFTAGTMDKLGLSYETLKSLNPELVYASIRGFGDPQLGESPYAERPAFDYVAQAMGGFMSITGSDESGPVKAGPGVGDIFPAVLATTGILSAVYHRNRTGEGQYVDVSMVDGVLALTERIVYQYSINGEVPGLQGNSHPLFFPYDRFETKDGHIVLIAITNKQWSALCRHIGRPDLAEEYPEREDRIDNAEELRQIITDWTKQYSKEELFDELSEDVPTGPIYNARDIFTDEHFQSRDMLQEVEHADTDETITIAGSPIKFSETPSGVERRAPLLGEHTKEVLCDAGLSEERITDLEESGDIQRTT